MLTNSQHRAPYALASILLALAVAACGNKDEKKTTTQVAAKVGSEEISVHQINQVLSRTSAQQGATSQAIQATRKEILEKLIDQQLAVDQATELKLHRSPEVLAQLDAARREVLARAYVQQLASTLSKPSSEETRKYYAGHPQLFAERRIFNLQEIVVPKPDAAVAQQLRAMVATGKSAEDIAASLKSRAIKFSAGAAVRPAEQIPLELLTKVHALKDGQATILESAQGMTVLRVASSQSVPVAEAAALPRIEQFLNNQRGAELVARNIKELRAKTAVTYVGEFAQTTGAVNGSTAVAAPAATSLEPNVPRVPATPTSAPAQAALSDAAMQKGLGLKK